MLRFGDDDTSDFSASFVKYEEEGDVGLAIW